jgi:hypothetical protein
MEGTKMFLYDWTGDILGEGRGGPDIGRKIVQGKVKGIPSGKTF